MNALSVAFLLVNAVALLFLPRRLAPLPLLVAACYMTLNHRFDIGPFSFTVIRVLVAVGVARILARGERIAGGMQLIDWLFILWSGWFLFASLWHNRVGGPIFASGVIYNVAGIYFLIRVFCQSREDLVILCKIIGVVLVPVAIEMIGEHVLRRNSFSFLGGVSENPVIRNGRLRAQGPFLHSILAGTVGGVCLPLMIGIWNYHRRVAVVGIAACLVMVMTSSSSGPIMTVGFGIVAVGLWRYRRYCNLALPMAFCCYLFLEVVMTRPAYYIIANIDLTGGSTGYHRARLINETLKHFEEWWRVGTDFTRHWMPTGVSWSPDHTDLTNYYIQMGVWGGLGLLVFYLAILWRSFRTVSADVRTSESDPSGNVFLMWCLGAALFAHAATGVSVSYFDQSYIFLYITIAAITSFSSSMREDADSDSYCDEES